MSLVIGTVLAFIFLEWPWRGLVLIPLALLEAGEIMLWLRLRGVPSITGAEALVGSHGRAVGDLRPEGQVRVKGQLWKARRVVEVGADEVRDGDEVTVVRVDGMSLEVVPRIHDPAAPPR